MTQIARPDMAEKTSRVVVAAILMLALISALPPLTAFFIFGLLYVATQKQTAAMKIYRDAEAKRLGAILHLTILTACIVTCGMIVEHKIAEREKEVSRIIEEVQGMRISTETVAPVIAIPFYLRDAWPGRTPREISGYRANSILGINGGDVMLLCSDDGAARIFLPQQSLLTIPALPDGTCKALAATKNR